MRRYHEMEAAGVWAEDDPDSADDPIAAVAPAIPPLPAVAKEQQETPAALPATQTKIAAKTATLPRPNSKPGHQPTIAIPVRTARKLNKSRPVGLASPRLGRSLA